VFAPVRGAYLSYFSVDVVTLLKFPWFHLITSAKIQSFNLALPLIFYCHGKQANFAQVMLLIWFQGLQLIFELQSIQLPFISSGQSERTIG